MRNLELFWKESEQAILNYSPKILIAILIIVVFYFIAKLAKRISLKFYSKLYQKESHIANIISVIIYCLILFFGIFLSLEVLGLESVLAKMIAGAGVVGIVAGFAFKEIASNAFAGFLLSVQRPFKKGDWVELDSKFGKVRTISLITTSIETIAGQEVFIPNQIIYSNSFTNYSSFGKRRVILKSGVSYGDDLEHVKSVALDEVKNIDVVLKNERIDFYFTEIGDSTYNFELRFWINFDAQADFMGAMSETIIRIKKRFEKEDISLAYSVTTLDFGVKGGVNLFDKAVTIQKEN